MGRVIKLNLKNARNKEKLHINGQFLAYDSGTTNIKIYMDITDENYIILKPRKSIRDIFGTVYISHAAIDETITLYVSKNPEANMDFEETTEFTVNVTASGGNQLTDKADVTLTQNVATLIQSGSSDRKKITITSIESNTSEIRLGTSSVAADRGIPLQSGDSAESDDESAIYGFTAGAGQKVAVLESERV